MILTLFTDGESLALAAAEPGSLDMRDAIADRGACRIVSATAASQFDFWKL